MNKAELEENVGRLVVSIEDIKVSYAALTHAVVVLLAHHRIAEQCEVSDTLDERVKKLKALLYEVQS